jgi:curved DNA-binding protein CbpA
VLIFAAGYRCRQYMHYSKDYYAILQISRSATNAEIRTAYIAQCKKWHPDTYSGADATQKMQDINEAKDVLLDTEKRKSYDYQTTPGNSSKGHTHNPYAGSHTYSTADSTERYAQRYEELKIRMAGFMRTDQYLFQTYAQQLKGSPVARLVNALDNWDELSVQFIDMTIYELHEHRKYPLQAIYSRIKEKPRRPAPQPVAEEGKKSNMVLFWVFIVIINLLVRGCGN